MEKQSISERIKRFPSLPSTNEYCKENDLKNGEIILAERQSSGRGRMGRSFSSEMGGIYISFCYNPKGVTPSDITKFTGMTAVAVADSIREICKVDAKIKWLNDILLEGKKICGILAEAVLGSDQSIEKLIVGIGINANQSDESFAGELADIASSIKSITGKEVDTEALILKLAEEIDSAFDALVSKKNEVIGSYIAKYISLCSTIGKRVSILRPSLAVNEEDIRETFKKNPEAFPSALATGIDDSFRLIIEHEDGKTEALFSGEISIR